MTDLERFFRQLVERVAASDPARLHRPLPLDEITHTLLPYRANRRTLGVDTSEDYELLVMRLCAGEDGLARTEPEEARARFARELASPNPDLAALHSFESVLVTLRPAPLARALDSAHRALEASSETLDERDDAHDVLSLSEIPGLEVLRGGDAERSDPEPDARASDAGELEFGGELEPDPDPETIPEPEPPARCLYCGGRLPTARAVNFCPHCGQSQTLTLCPECRSEIEPGWKHCVSCGRAVSET